MSTGHDARTQDVGICAATAVVEEARVGSAGTSAPASERVAEAICEWLLGMPVGVAWALMWATGVALLGSLALVVYEVGSALVGLVAGSA